jgi:hypothetical protein
MTSSFFPPQPLAKEFPILLQRFRLCGTVYGARAGSPALALVTSKNEESVLRLLFVIERFAVRANLDFRLLPICINLSLVGDELTLLGERLDLEDRSFTGFGL